MTYGCKIMVSLTLCGFFGTPCVSVRTETQPDGWTNTLSATNKICLRIKRCISDRCNKIKDVGLICWQYNCRLFLLVHRSGHPKNWRLGRLPPRQQHNYLPRGSTSWLGLLRQHLCRCYFDLQPRRQKYLVDKKY